jgi:hypothetical protein
MISGLRGNDLLLETRQQQFPFGQGQPQIGDVTEVVGPVDRHDVNKLLLTVSPGFHQPHNPSHASPPKREKGRETTASAPAPPISRQSHGCALILVGVEEMQPLQARMTFAMARQVVVEMARSFGVSPSRYTGGDRLPHEDYVRMISILGEAGVKWTSAANAEETLAALRATYEPLLDGLAGALLLPLPGWIATDDADHWQRGHRGLIASHLVEELSSRTDHGDDSGTRHDRISQRLRSRLRRE